MPGRLVKCVVWDLDGTLWDGNLLEGSAGSLMPGMIDAIRTLDERGILNSIASKNEWEPALDRLRAFGIDEYFLYPRVGWGPKSKAICEIARDLRMATAAVAFIDDQEFERHEVQHAFPDMLCLDPLQIDDALSRAEFNPIKVTEESRRRRLMIRGD